ncbi:unnamed protein product [Vitrella brassicaformis CCMP3155]|uniref:Uncharacterized protein n=2 Tax=Vitrella brassicaformis TaxID=1169539 RepID=A0A0G4H6R7_VITBC|nr:unnamed protein product [Vitrella brassicaformis CCMP3155]|eukprot:CEM39497.1 unnamed protein product [Vitrella brassicaformis CCMP3155]
MQQWPDAVAALGNQKGKNGGGFLPRVSTCRKLFTVASGFVSLSHKEFDAVPRDVESQFLCLVGQRVGAELAHRYDNLSAPEMEKILSDYLTVGWKNPHRGIQAVYRTLDEVPLALTEGTFLVLDWKKSHVLGPSGWGPKRILGYVGLPHSLEALPPPSDAPVPHCHALALPPPRGHPAHAAAASALAAAKPHGETEKVGLALTTCALFPFCDLRLCKLELPLPPALSQRMEEKGFQGRPAIMRACKIATYGDEQKKSAERRRQERAFAKECAASFDKIRLNEDVCRGFQWAFSDLARRNVIYHPKYPALGGGPKCARVLQQSANIWDALSHIVVDLPETTHPRIPRPLPPTTQPTENDPKLPFPVPAMAAPPGPEAGVLKFNDPPKVETLVDPPIFSSIPEGVGIPAAVPYQVIANLANRQKLLIAEGENEEGNSDGDTISNVKVEKKTGDGATDSPDGRQRSPPSSGTAPSHPGGKGDQCRTDGGDTDTEAERTERPDALAASSSSTPTPAPPRDGSSVPMNLPHHPFAVPVLSPAVFANGMGGMRGPYSFSLPGATSHPPVAFVRPPFFTPRPPIAAASANPQPSPSPPAPAPSSAQPSVVSGMPVAEVTQPAGGSPAAGTAKGGVGGGSFSVPPSQVSIRPVTPTGAPGSVGSPGVYLRPLVMNMNMSVNVTFPLTFPFPGPRPAFVAPHPSLSGAATVVGSVAVSHPPSYHPKTAGLVTTSTPCRPPPPPVEVKRESNAQPQSTPSPVAGPEQGSESAAGTTDAPVKATSDCLPPQRSDAHSLRSFGVHPGSPATDSVGQTTQADSSSSTAGPSQAHDNPQPDFGDVPPANPSTTTVHSAHEDGHHASSSIGALLSPPGPKPLHFLSPPDGLLADPCLVEGMDLGPGLSSSFDTFQHDGGSASGDHGFAPFSMHGGGGEPRMPWAYEDMHGDGRGADGHQNVKDQGGLGSPGVVPRSALEGPAATSSPDGHQHGMIPPHMSHMPFDLLPPSGHSLLPISATFQFTQQPLFPPATGPSSLMLSNPLLLPGARMAKGDSEGLMGSCGSPSMDHLHPCGTTAHDTISGAYHRQQDSRKRTVRRSTQLDEIEPLPPQLYPSDGQIPFSSSCSPEGHEKKMQLLVNHCGKGMTPLSPAQQAGGSRRDASTTSAAAAVRGQRLDSKRSTQRYSGFSRGSSEHPPVTVHPSRVESDSDSGDSSDEESGPPFTTTHPHGWHLPPHGAALHTPDTAVKAGHPPYYSDVLPPFSRQSIAVADAAARRKRKDVGVGVGEAMRSDKRARVGGGGRAPPLEMTSEADRPAMQLPSVFRDGHDDEPGGIGVAPRCLNGGHRPIQQGGSGQGGHGPS